MLSDIEIAQNAKMKKITEIASQLGITKNISNPTGIIRLNSRKAFIRDLLSDLTENLFSLLQ